MPKGPELADSGNLADLVRGNTNAFIALREGWTSEEVIGKVKQGIEKTEPSEYMWGPMDAVIRISEDGTAECAWFSKGMCKALLFDAYGHVTRQSRGLAYSLSAAFGLFHIMPKRKASREAYFEIRTRAAGLVSQNKADLGERVNGIEVYLEGPEGLALIHGKQVTPVQMKGDEKFLTGPDVVALKILAHYLGANALLSYAQASPARATPVKIM